MTTGAIIGVAIITAISFLGFVGILCWAIITINYANSNAILERMKQDELAKINVSRNFVRDVHQLFDEFQKIKKNDCCSLQERFK